MSEPTNAEVLAALSVLQTWGGPHDRNLDARAIARRMLNAAAKARSAEREVREAAFAQQVVDHARKVAAQADDYAKAVVETANAVERAYKMGGKL